MTSTPGSGIGGTFERPWDVAVVGAGPAGAMAARQLARGGLSVVLIDKAKFPRDKACGCCLSAAALSTLASVGLDDLPGRLGARPLSLLHLAAPGARASLAIQAVSVSRAAFDWALIREARAAGVQFLPETLATVDASGQLGVRSAGTMGTTDLAAATILIADGLAGSSLAERPDLAVRAIPGSRIGVATILSDSPDGYPCGAIHMCIGRGGYVGAVRLEDDRLNIAAALDPDFIRNSHGPGPAIASLLGAATMPPIPELRQARFHATPTLSRRRPILESGRILILGDAAGYVEPFTGEGIAWALASAIAIAPAVLARGRLLAKSVRGNSWRRTHARLIAPRQHLCSAVAWTLRRPRLATAVIRVLSQAPCLAHPALGRIAAPFAVPEPTP